MIIATTKISSGKHNSALATTFFTAGWRGVVRGIG